MRNCLENTLDAIDLAVSQQADRVESMVRAAYRGLSERCLGTADEVLAMEAVINESEVMIEDQCVQALALQQPVAIDLRRVTGALKINADLERIADLALNLAERTESLAAFPDIAVPSELADMVSFAIDMLRDAKRAFIDSDAALARDVCRRDNELDEMNRQMIEGLITAMETNPGQVSGYVQVFSASRTVERMGDHATNIAEDVEYIVDGEITRHRGS